LGRSLEANNFSKKQEPLNTKDARLKKTLDELYDNYLSEFRNSPADFFIKRRDPILFPHRYSGFLDIEAAAFLAATFAYGNVTSLCAFVERLLGMLGPSPAAFLRQGPRAVDSLAAHNLYYRLHKSDEILSLLHMLARVYADHGSLYNTYEKTYDSHSTTKENMIRFVGTLRDLAGTPLRFLVPSPEDGSTCKRLNLFMRWMVRRDGIDFGLWETIPPSSLVIPADTHIGRTAYRLGWIKTPSLTWQKAEAITAALRRFDPDDPTRYDFSLCHESIARRLSPGTGRVRIHRRER
jgi:uncharacterized protein (TIGR02757 family)